MIMGITFIALLIFLSGMDNPTVWNIVGVLVCMIILGFAGIRRSYGKRKKEQNGRYR